MAIDANEYVRSSTEALTRIWGLSMGHPVPREILAAVADLTQLVIDLETDQNVSPKVTDQLRATA
ncbi:hypothetical protein, partial [Kitasatospora nipponensis]